LNVTGALLNNGAFNLSDNVVVTVRGDLTNAGTFTQADDNFTTVNITGNLNNSTGGTYTVGYGGVTNALAVNNAAGAIINVDGGFDGQIPSGQLNSTLGIDNAGVMNLTTNAGFGVYGGVVTPGALVTNESTGTINVDSYASMTAPGFTNNGTLAVQASGVANFQGGGAGSFSNLSGGTLTGGTYVIGGTFQFDAANGVVNNIATGTSLTLDAQNGGVYQVLSGKTNALANLQGNAGSLALTNGATLNTDTTANGGPGTFTNTGTVTTAGTGSNAFNVTGNIFNTSPGVVNLNGTGDKMTATGQFTNTGKR